MLKNEYGIFTDITDRKGNIVQTAEEVYKDCLLGKNTNKIDNCLEVKSNQELTEENKLLKEQVKALTEANDFQEELIVEMAALVYA